MVGFVMFASSRSYKLWWTSSQDRISAEGLLLSI